MIYFFGASWCPQCKAMMPIVKELQSEGYQIEIKDADKDGLTLANLDIMSIPVFLKGNKTLYGIQSKQDVINFIK